MQFSKGNYSRSLSARRAACLIGVSMLACNAGMAQAQEDDDNDGGSDGLEEIVVTGQRANVINSIRDKRNSDAIKDILSADDADRLPDPNVAESLARLPGISFLRENDTGQGEFVSIRGMDAAYNTVTYDGIRTSTADTYRRTALDIVTSSNISGVEVLKAPLPEHATEGLGGVINIISRGPLERRDRLSISGDLTKNSFDSRTGSRISGGFNKKLSDRVAVNMSASWRRSYINTLYINPATNVPELNVATTLSGPNGDMTFLEEDELKTVPSGFVPVENFNVEQVNYEDNNLVRDNLTLSGAVGFQVSDNTEWTFGGRRVRQQTDDTYSNLELDVDNGDILSDGMGGYLVSTYPDPEVTFEGEVQDEIEIRERYYAKGRTVMDNWTFDYVVGYSRAFEDQPIMSLDFTHELEDTPSGLSDNSDENINTYAPFDFSNSPFIMPVPVNMAAFQEALDPFCDDGGCGEMVDFDEELQDSLENKRWNYRFDTTYDFDNHDFMRSIKFGVQYENSKYHDYRHVIASVDESIDDVTGEYKGYNPSGDNNADLGDYGLVDGSLRTFDDIGDPFASVGLHGIPLWNGDAMRSLRQQVRDGFFASGDEGVIEEVSSDENYYTAYVQAKMNFDKLDIIGGIRVEKYKATFVAPTTLSGSVFFDDGDTGDSVSLVDPSSTYNTTNNENTVYLPRIAFNYNLRDDIRLRLAYSSSIARPSFDRLAAEVDGDFDIELAEGVALADATAADVVDVDIDFSIGNPALKNTYSHNFDVSLETYIDDENAITVAAYYKRINNFLFSSFTTSDLTGSEGVTLTEDFDPSVAFEAAPFTDEGRALLDQLGGLTSLVNAGAGNVTINMPQNGRTAELYGIELGVWHTFSWLGGFWENVGFTGNMTLQDTKTTMSLGVLEDTDAYVLLGYANAGDTLNENFQFFNSPNFLWNAQLYYQDDKWEATIGYRYGGRQLEEVELYGISQYQQARGFLSASIERRFEGIGNGVTIFLTASDILDGGKKPTTFETRGKEGIYSDFATFNGRSAKMGFRVSF